MKLHWITGSASISRPAAVAAAALFLLVFVMAPAVAKKSGKHRPPADATPRNLVWPLPPEPPRVRWLGEIRNLDEVKGKTKKKRSWFARVAGARAPDEQPPRLFRPYGIAVDSRGRIYVADGAQREVFVLDRAERRVEVRGASPRAPLALPIGVALDKNDRLFVSDSFLHSITCFDPQGRLLAQFGAEKLVRAAGIAVDRPRHRLYVADAKADRIAVFDTNSFQFERYIGGPSTPGLREPGRFAAPTNVAVDRQGNLYVSDTWNYRVQVFDVHGRFVRTFGAHGIRPGDFVRPKGIAVDSEGHVYVADAEFNNFQIFTPKGQPLLAVGSIGVAPGQFTLIAGLCIDAEDRIYTTEQWDGRVQIFKYLPLPAPAGKEVDTAAQ